MIDALFTLYASTQTTKGECFNQHLIHMPSAHTQLQWFYSIIIRSHLILKYGYLKTYAHHSLIVLSPLTLF